MNEAHANEATEPMHDSETGTIPLAIEEMFTKEQLAQMTTGPEPAEKVDPVQLINGLYIDTDTGEIVGYELPEGMAETQARGEGDAAEEIPSQEFVEWIMERLQRREVQDSICDTNLVPLYERKAKMEAEWLEVLNNEPAYVQLSTMIDNIEAVKVANQKVKTSFFGRFYSVLDRFATATITGKVRNWKSWKGVGTLALSQQQAAVEILDETRKVELAKLLNVPVKVIETVSLTDLKKPIIAAYKIVPALDAAKADEWTEEEKQANRDYHTLLTIPGVIEYKAPYDKLKVDCAPKAVKA